MARATILIIEDEPTVAEDLCQKLGHLGYKIDGITERGEVLVNLVRDRRPDFVLVDIDLHGRMDGIETAEQIRRECALPVILLASSLNQAAKQRAELKRPFGYVLKTCEELELKTNLEMALRLHRTETMLQQQREWLRATLTGIRDAVLATDIAGRITFLNPVAAALTGWQEEQAVGQPVEKVLQIINDKTREPAEHVVARALRENSAVGPANHMALVARGGREIHIEDSTAPILDATGNVAGVVVVFHDTSEQSRVLEALRESEVRYGSLFKHMLDGFAYCRVLYEGSSPRDFIYLKVNDAFEKLTGLKNVEGKKVSEVIPGLHQSSPDLLQIYARVALTGRPEKFEEYLETLDKWFSIAVYSPEREHFVAVFDNITERKRAEEALARSERLYRAIGESIEYGVWVCEPEGRNIYASDSFLKLVGMTQEQCSNFGWGDVLHPEDEEKTIAAWKECVRTGGIWDIQHRFRGVDGNWHPVLARGVPVRDDQGHLMCWAGINLDISRLKQIETDLGEAKDELARTNANLERLVQERTAALQELVGELEHFSYTITHDMRAPLRGIRGFAELMAQACSACQEKVPKDFLRRVKESADRMDLLITDALSYGKAMRQEMALEPVDAEALLRGMLDSYPELQPSNAQIEIRGKIPLVMANVAGLTQCFSNLLGNAVKFVKPGELPQVVIEAEQRGGWVRLWFRDRGIGIPKTMLASVFEMFSRGHPAYEGTGIGLGLVQKVIKRMGGNVGVESEEDQGSRFWLELKPGDARA